MSGLKDFKNAVNAACMREDPEPEHGPTAYLDVLELLLQTRTVVASSDSVETAKNLVLDYLSGPC